AFALPGNPVSGIAIFLTLLKPALSALAGANGQATVVRARLALPIDKRHARAEFQRARLASDAQAQLWATPQTRQGSGMLRGVAEGDAPLVLPEAASGARGRRPDRAAGRRARLQRWRCSRRARAAGLATLAADIRLHNHPRRI